MFSTRYIWPLFVALLAAGPASAAVVNVNFDPSVTRTAKQISPTTTFWRMGRGTGFDVIGLFSAGPAEMIPFLSAADPCGAATGRFTLSGCGDTFSNPWELVNNDFANSGYLEQVFIRLFEGGDVFDIDDPNPGTPGSAAGNTFDLLPGLGPNDVVSATYSHEVRIQNALPVGDIWGWLSIDLRGITSQGGRGLAEGLQFVADTDPIPLPAALPLLCGALGGLAALRRRRHAG